MEAIYASNQSFYYQYRHYTDIELMAAPMSCWFIYELLSVVLET